MSTTTKAPTTQAFSIVFNDAGKVIGDPYPFGNAGKHELPTHWVSMSATRPGKVRSVTVVVQADSDAEVVRKGKSYFEKHLASD